MFQNGFKLLTVIAWITTLFSPTDSSNHGCSTDLFRLGTKCYEHYFQKPTTFSNAEEICVENSGKIAIFENGDISQFLINIGIKYKFQRYAVDVGNTRGCNSISFKDNFEIQPVNCRDYMFFACEFEIDIDSSQNCSWHENKCYKLMYSRKPAGHANFTCSKLKGRLASVKTPGELEFFKKLLEDVNAIGFRWWNNIHEKVIKRMHLSDFLVFWSGKRINGYCGVISHNYLNSSADCDAHNYFFCEYNAHPDIVPDTNTNPTTSFTTAEATRTIEPTTNTLESSSTQPSTIITSEEPTSKDLVTSTWSSATTSIESKLITDTVTQNSDYITEQEPKPEKDEKEDSTALKPIEFTIIGIIGGLIIIITIVIVQIFKLRKKLFSKYNGDREKPRPQTLPLLPPSPTSLTVQQSPTTDGDYLTPYTSINSLPSDDTQDGDPIPIRTWNVPIHGLRFGIEDNILYGDSPEGLQMASWSSQEPICPDHHYEEIQ